MNINAQIEAARDALLRAYDDPEMDADDISELREELYQLELRRQALELN